MKIQKRRAKQWSLQEIESRPGITTLEVMEELIEAMQFNGWEFGEMASWFNEQKDSAGRPKFLNNSGAALNYANCSHIYHTQQKRIKLAKKRHRAVPPPSTKNSNYGKPKTRQLFLEVLVKHQGATPLTFAEAVSKVQETQPTLKTETFQSALWHMKETELCFVDADRRITLNQEKMDKIQEILNPISGKRKSIKKPKAQVSAPIPLPDKVPVFSDQA